MKETRLKIEAPQVSFESYRLLAIRCFFFFSLRIGSMHMCVLHQYASGIPIMFFYKVNISSSFADILMSAYKVRLGDFTLKFGRIRVLYLSPMTIPNVAFLVSGT